MAFNAKNLSYDANEPAFLRKLRQEQAGIDTRQNQSTGYSKRPRGKKLLDNDDDSPTYVGDDNGLLSKEEIDLIMSRETGHEGAVQPVGNYDNSEIVKDHGQSQHEKSKHEIHHPSVTGRAPRKRKVGKVLGQEPADELKVPATSGTHNNNSSKKKRKHKAIKLSFDEEAEKS